MDLEYSLVIIFLPKHLHPQLAKSQPFDKNTVEGIHRPRHQQHPPFKQSLCS